MSGLEGALNSRKLAPGVDVPGGGADLPPPPVPPSDRGGPPDRPPRRDPRAWLPWIVLGAGIITVERLAMLTFAVAGLGWMAYALAASVFATVVIVGLAVGGRAFARAWHDANHSARRPDRPRHPRA